MEKNIYNLKLSFKKVNLLSHKELGTAFFLFSKL